jgi:AbrB family looped-hinge helix DNA binding protein
MDTTMLSTKGQIVLPKTLRETRRWPPGTEFRVEETPEGVLLRPLKHVAESTLSEVAGCLRWTGKPKTVAQMRGAIARKIKSRHDGGRY